MFHTSSTAKKGHEDTDFRNLPGSGSPPKIRETDNCLKELPFLMVVK